MSNATWFDEYRRYVAGMVFSGVVSSGLRLPLYESRSMCSMVASVVTLIPEAQRVGLIFKREQLAQDPSYMVAELFVTTRDGWELSMDVAVKYDDFVEYDKFAESLVTELKKLSRSAPKGEMVQYIPTGETLRGYLDNCFASSPWTTATRKATDFLYSANEVTLPPALLADDANSDTYQLPIPIRG